MFVSGPVGTSVTGSGGRRGGAPPSTPPPTPGAGEAAGSGRSAPSRPRLAVDRRPGPTARGRSGRSAPAATGTSVRPRSVSTRSALRVVRASAGVARRPSSSPAPRAAGEASASRIASASSWPGIAVEDDGTAPLGSGHAPSNGLGACAAMARACHTPTATPYPWPAHTGRCPRDLSRPPRFPWPRLDDTVTMRASDRPAAPGRSIDRATPGESAGRRSRSGGGPECTFAPAWCPRSSGSCSS